MVALSLPVSWPASIKIREGLGITPGSLLGQEDIVEITQSFQLGVSYIRPSFKIQNLASWHPLPLDPNSMGHMLFELCTIVFLTIDLTLIPLVLAWDLPLTDVWMSFNIFSVLFWTADIGISFTTSFTIDGEVCKSFPLIAKRYMRTYFALDFGIVLCDWFSTVFVLIAGSNSHSPLRVLRFTRAGRISRLAGLIRLERVHRISNELMDHYVSEGTAVFLRMLGIFLLVLWLNHMIACAWYGLLQLPSDTGMRWVETTSAGEETTSYLYTTSFHWAIAQLTLGAIEVSATTTSERIFNILLLLAGLLFSSLVVSTLSATMISFHMRGHATNAKLQTLRAFCHQQHVGATLTHRVKQQVENRLQRTAKLTEKDVLALSLLSSSMRSELRFDIYKRFLTTHPLFNMWINVSPSTVVYLCTEAMTYQFLQPHDDLFAAGSKSTHAYYVAGRLKYCQDRESSPSRQASTETTNESVWICEAALWTNWIHVGSAFAETAGQVLAICAEQMIRSLDKQRLIREIAQQYARIFHKRVVEALPPYLPWPSDLQVPATEFGEMVLNMDHPLRVLIGLDALKQISCGPFRIFSSRHLVDVLRKEIMDGKSTVYLNANGEIERFASVIVLRIVRDGLILVQLGIHDDTFQPACVLPGSKVRANENPSDAVDRIVRTRLGPLLSDVTINAFQRGDESTQEQESRRFNLKTKYLRTTVFGTVPNIWMSPQHCIEAHPRSSARPSLLDLTERKVYIFKWDDGRFGVYAWLQEEEFRVLKDEEKVVRDWFQRLNVDSKILDNLDQSSPAVPSEETSSLCSSASTSSTCWL